MFCPACGEKNAKPAPCCSSCGMDLQRFWDIFNTSPSSPEGETGDNQRIPVAPPVVEERQDTIPVNPGCEADQGNGVDPDIAGDPVRLKDLGNDFFRQEKYLDALDCYEKAIAIDQFYEEAWYNKSIALKRIGRVDQSKVCWGIYKRILSRNNMPEQ